MEPFSLIAVLLCLAAFFGYINERLFKLPLPIALMAFSLLFSLLLILLGKAGLPFDVTARAVLQQFDFSVFLLHGILSFLLFAGAMRADINDLLTQKRIVILLATAGVVVSTAIVGLLSKWLLSLLGFDIPLIYWLLFKSLLHTFKHARQEDIIGIEPVDDIAGAARKAGVDGIGLAVILL